MKNLVKKILEKEQIEYKNIQKSEAGFSNDVYFIDDKLVLKISRKDNIKKLKKEIEIYKNVKIKNMPKYILSGEIQDLAYLIIEKLQGKTLYNVWHLLNEEERKDTILKMCNILRDFSNQPYFYLEGKYKCLDWLKKWEKSFELNIALLKERNFDTTILEDFCKNKLSNIMQEQKLKLVFNDSHFDNFILTEQKELYIIDFDRVMYASLDYELLILDSMLDNPTKFASLEEEKLVNDDDYKNIRDYLKQFYPEMYDFEYINERVFLYKFFYKLGAGFEYNRNKWLKNALDEFVDFYYKKEIK